MKNNKFLRIIIVTLILLSFFILCFLLYLIVMFNLKDNTEANVSVTTTNNETEETIEESLAGFDCIFWRQEDNYIYVTFSKDLFDENGKSNEIYFKSIVKGMSTFFPNKDFYLKDYNKNIEIYAKYDRKNEKYSMIINSVEDYFDKASGKEYNDIANINYPKEAEVIESIDSILTTLKNNSMKFSSIKNMLGDGIDNQNGYISYLDDTIKIRVVNNSIVRNIVFSKDYKEKIFKNFENNASIKEIYEKNPDNCFGGINQGYLGYRTNLMYYFIYEDEISVYGYSYKKNDLFEESLRNYCNDNDFGKFVKLITGQLPTYDYCEYDEERKNANIMFSSYGLEVNIENNNSKGVILYNNYYFTDSTKELVKNGYITFKNNENSIEKMELERRKAKGR